MVSENFGVTFSEAGEPELALAAVRGDILNVVQRINRPDPHLLDIELAQRELDEAVIGLRAIREAALRAYNARRAGSEPAPAPSSATEGE